MEKLDDYKDDISYAIKGGFFDVEDIVQSFLELGLPESETTMYIRKMFKEHNIRSKTSTDVLKLQRFFDEISKEGYLALHKAGFTSSDVFDTIDIALEETNYKPCGYLAYHEQDLNRVIETGTFTLAFGAFRDTEQTSSNGMSKQETGYEFKERLESLGFTVDWDGSPDRKIEILDFNYVKAYDEEDWSYFRCVELFPG